MACGSWKHTGGVNHVNAYGGYRSELPSIPKRAGPTDQQQQRFCDCSTLPKEQIQEWRRGQAEIDRRRVSTTTWWTSYTSSRSWARRVSAMGPTGRVAEARRWRRRGGEGVAELEDVLQLPRITEPLLKAGYSETDVARMWSGTLLCVVGEAQALGRPVQP